MTAAPTALTLPLPCHDDEKWKVVEKLLVGPEAPPATTPSELDALIGSLSGEPCEFFSFVVSSTQQLYDWPGLFASLPAIRQLASEMPTLFPSPVPLLVTPNIGSVELTRRQTACLIAHSFFGTITGVDSPQLDFNMFSVRLLLTRPGSNIFAVMCVFNYLRRVATLSPLPRNLVFRRHRVTAQPEWKTSAKPLCNVQLLSSGSITDSTAPWHADFANEYIGGGALSGGCAQEEILFAIKPELMASMAIMGVMDRFDAIVLEGAERYNATKGYGFTIEFINDEPTRADFAMTPPPNVLAFDAVVAFSVDQTARANMVRDTHKAYVAFHAAGAGATIATGNWGCGAFGGDPQLKFLQQWIAASEAGTGCLEYYTFGNPAMAYVIEKMSELCAKFKTVGSLATALLSGSQFTAESCILDQILARAVCQH